MLDIVSLMNIIINDNENPAKIVAFVDPTDREELVCKGRLTIVTNSHGELCGMFKTWHKIFSEIC